MVTDANTAMAPRAVIEYVEAYEMPKFSITESNRGKKWELFFNTPTGKDLLECIGHNVPTWKNNSSEVTRRIQGIYQYSAEYHHNTAYEINDTKEIVVKGELIAQTMMLVSCIAKIFDLKIAS